MAEWVKNLPAKQEMQVRSLEEGMETHSCILAWRIPWTEEPAGLQSMGLYRLVCSIVSALIKQQIGYYTAVKCTHLTIYSVGQKVLNFSITLGGSDCNKSPHAVLTATLQKADKVTAVLQRKKSGQRTWAMSPLPEVIQLPKI